MFSQRFRTIGNSTWFRIERKTLSPRSYSVKFEGNTFFECTLVLKLEDFGVVLWRHISTQEKIDSRFFPFEFKFLHAEFFKLSIRKVFFKLVGVILYLK